MSGVDLLDWAAPGPYRVAFSTRLGGVSEAEFASLNLGILTEDDPARVVVNRTRLCEAVDADPDGATMAWQRHGGTVTRAQPRGIITPGTVYDHCDGLWSDAPGRAMLLLTADCMPIAIARSDGVRPAVEILHAGWRGLLAGIVAAGVRAIGARKLVAVIGPSIGPCCYEVGDEVATPFRQAFGEDVVQEGSKLDLWTAAERALRAAGVEQVDRFDLCTACHGDRFFSHRRDHGRTGRQGVIAYVS
ncbi:MAG: purine-nucleoside/S-methyl-5-thioadenosine phosphorylase / adenosine deaminase [Gaiellales bacterium]|nr:purine-nucleoside/S-methyl-5-thioadenosine phosphorylase / adenosine deaminase [Gaiellales bacterium]